MPNSDPWDRFHKLMIDSYNVSKGPHARFDFLWPNSDAR